jgi:hypothetical protein
MTEPYIRASGLKDFAFCQRAWFLGAKARRLKIPTPANAGPPTTSSAPPPSNGAARSTASAAF